MKSLVIIDTAEDLLLPTSGANKPVLDLIRALADRFDLAVITYGAPGTGTEYAAALGIAPEHIHVLRTRTQATATLSAALRMGLRSCERRRYPAEHAIIASYRTSGRAVRLLADGISGAPLASYYSSGALISCHDCASEMFRAEAQLATDAKARLIASMRHRAARDLERRYLPLFEVVHVLTDGDAQNLREVDPRIRCAKIGLASHPQGSASHTRPSTGVPGGRVLIWGDLSVGFVARGMRQICHRLAGAGISVLGSAPASTFKSVIGPVGDAFTYYERVADLDGFLSNFDIVVIPDDAGSGQKNRTLDAIRLGKCVVGRPAAFLGLPPADPPYYVTVSSSDEVAPCLQNLLVSGAFSNIGKIARKEFDARFSWEAFRKRWWHLLEGMSTLKMRTGAE